ncbi:MAG: methyltransferase [Myxococcaceae bacterium]|nr:methyltransferase [Myxococcaceae bacterium]
MEVHHERRRGARDRELMLVLGGAGFFRVVVAAHRLGLFTLLAERPGVLRDDVGPALGLPQRSVITLLMACQALGWVERDAAGGLRNAPWVGPALASTSQTFPSLLEAFDQLMYGAFEALETSLREGTNAGLARFPGPGTTLYERLSAHPALESVFHAWMSRLSEAGLPQRLVDALTPATHVLDVGGGDGTNAVVLARAYPHLRVTVLDLPSICERVRARAADEGLSDRIDARPFDLRHDELPSGADAVLFSRIFNIYGEATNQALVERSFRALPTGGRLVVFPAMVSDDDGAGPLGAAFLSLYFLNLATGEGRVYAPGDYERWFARAGFASFSCEVDERDEAVIVGTK